METSEWMIMIQKERERKNAFFQSNYNSPIPFENRWQFKGLDYYPPNPDFLFALELHEHAEKKILKIKDTKGNEREFLKWGEFRFKIEAKECILQAYKSDPQEDRLFIPFRDKTNSNETYGAGRYIDLDYEEHYTKENKWILDFNKAYNPWCAYSINYACPYIDPENWLEVSIRAGEKNYSIH